LDLLDPSNGPEFFWQVISGRPCIYILLLMNLHGLKYLHFKFHKNPLANNRDLGSKLFAETPCIIFIILNDISSRHFDHF
jgi:hypothetical protein